ncbi:CPBP family intramembrane glutamic endopeptidase [Peribacillus alkalitolerans]|uniref:CPBP family intramembrane glutamic endopeptidase n=1 Tax=Peribacillus alkalitolerans TaxID=1550385 RepID=UPI001F085062|nr:CPBP family intramembrane glutamic endopeptidase [Peribacillus alkalitolerans]
MSKFATDIRLIGGLIAAHILLFFSYHESPVVFWHLYTATSLFLISIAIISEKMDDQLPIATYLSYGIISGFLLYGLFWIGNLLVKTGGMRYFTNRIEELYTSYSPTMAWHFALLILIIIPGEEIFWRGLVQKRLYLYFSNPIYIIGLSAVLYSFPLLYAQNLVLVIAGLVCGIVWAGLYHWRRSIPLVIISHLVFDLLLLKILPLQ